MNYWLLVPALLVGAALVVAFADWLLFGRDQVADWLFEEEDE